MGGSLPFTLPLPCSENSRLSLLSLTGGLCSPFFGWCGNWTAALLSRPKRLIRFAVRPMQLGTRARDAKASSVPKSPPSATEQLLRVQTNALPPRRHVERSFSLTHPTTTITVGIVRARPSSGFDPALAKLQRAQMNGNILRPRVRPPLPGTNPLVKLASEEVHPRVRHRWARDVRCRRYL